MMLSGEDLERFERQYDLDNFQRSAHNATIRSQQRWWRRAAGYPPMGKDEEFDWTERVPLFWFRASVLISKMALMMRSRERIVRMTKVAPLLVEGDWLVIHSDSSVSIIKDPVELNPKLGPYLILHESTVNSEIVQARTVPQRY